MVGCTLKEKKILKKFEDMTLDDILFFEKDYTKSELETVLKLIPISMKYRKFKRIHSTMFFLDTNKIRKLPQKFIDRMYFDGKNWIYDDSRDKNGTYLNYIKTFIKDIYDKEVTKEVEYSPKPIYAKLSTSSHKWDLVTNTKHVKK